MYQDKKNYHASIILTFL